ncbi:TPA: helix-turn-helix domain-containing protein, partial [Escherichia coli]
IQKKAVFQCPGEGKSISTLAREFDTARQTFLRVKAAMEEADARSWAALQCMSASCQERTLLKETDNNKWVELVTLTTVLQL